MRDIVKIVTMYRKKHKPKYLKSKILFVIIVIILLLIILVPSLIPNREENFDVYTFEEFVDIYSNSSYSGEEDVFRVVEEVNGKPPEKDNPFFQVFEQTSCKDGCERRKVIINKQDKTVMIKKEKNEKEK